MERVLVNAIHKGSLPHYRTLVVVVHSSCSSISQFCVTPVDSDATSSPPKQKETWKGKVARTFKRYGSGSVLSPTQAAEVVGALGVPLESCQPSKVCEVGI